MKLRSSNIYTYIIISVLSICCVGCIEVKRAQQGDFNVLSGVNSKGVVMLDGVKDATATMDISAKYDWEVVNANGFVCVPSSGKATERTSIKIKALRSNNTTDTILLGNLYFKLLATRFTGLSVHQLPGMRVDKNNVVLSGAKGSKMQIFVTTNSEFQVSYNKDALFMAEADNEKGVVVVTSLEENTSEQDLDLGDITISLIDFPSCKAVVNVHQRIDNTPQTIIYYYLGTQLKYNYKDNIEATIEALSNNIQGRSRVMMFLQESTTDADLYELRYDATSGKVIQDKVKEYTLSTPYDVELLSGVFYDVIECAPAEKYGLIFGSHGTAWLPKEVSKATQRLLANMGLSYETIWQKREGANMTRNVGDGAKTQFNVEEIAEAIERNGKKFDYILFDACYMSNVESAYALRNATNYIIASPCEVMVWGFPYAIVLPELLKDGGRSYDLDKVCRYYVDFSMTATIPSGCVALVATAELEDLAKAMKAVNGATRNPDFAMSSVQTYEGLSSHAFYDLEDYVRQSCADAEVVEAFKTQMAKTVTSRYHTERFYTDFGNESMKPITYYSGISTSAGATKYEYDWKNTAWYKATH